MDRPQRTHAARRRRAVGGAAAMVVSLATACGSPEAPSEEQARAAATGETRGLVLSTFAMVIPEPDPGACPAGLNLNAKQFDEQHGREVATDCEDPGAHPDPGFQRLEAPGTLVGLDLDGLTSSSDAAGRCAHDDFDCVENHCEAKDCYPVECPDDDEEHPRQYW